MTELDVQKYIANLVANNRVLLFMKGNKTFPQCGFSSAVVSILKDVGVPFETANVLADPKLRDGIKEFLLVPYFGACVHSPPPPANQIIHVLPQSVPKSIRSMDPVWISGKLVREKTDSYMGAAGYRMQALLVEPYVDRPK